MIDWRQLEAGPELDAIVAERAFGQVPCDAWRRRNLGSGGGPVMTLREGDCAHESGKCYSPVRHRYVHGSGPPAYTTTWDGMGLVVERMRELGYGLDLSRLDSEGFLNPFSAAFLEGGYREWRMQADTGPLAVCRAALAALESTGKEPC